MIDLSRRSFLRGSILCAGAVVLAPMTRLLAAVPTIYGDMVHDDWPGLNALFTRQPVTILSDAVAVHSAERIELRRGRFLISKTLNPVRDTHIFECQFKVRSESHGSDDYAFAFREFDTNSIGYSRINF